MNDLYKLPSGPAGSDSKQGQHEIFMASEELITNSDRLNGVNYIFKLRTSSSV
jgi:hypothetical protein